jgi:hypothetical protein
VTPIGFLPVTLVHPRLTECPALSGIIAALLNENGMASVLLRARFPNPPCGLKFLVYYFKLRLVRAGVESPDTAPARTARRIEGVVCMILPRVLPVLVVASATVQ